MNEQAENKELAVAPGTTPAEILKIAVEGGADVDKIEKLMGLQERWDANNARKAYNVAMTEFKKNPPEIIKDKAVSYGAGKASYKHASLANVTENINTALSRHGLTASWQTAQNGAVTVICKITHVLGHSEETSLSAPADESGSKNKIQAIGSTVSYLQRYTLLALTGLATHEDDDGRGSQPAELIDDKQLSSLRDFVDNGTDEAKLLNYMGLETLDQMAKKDYQKAIAAIEASKEAGK